ncbi:FCD domain-containing protein [Pusillimonas sp. TS35]|nr:FCD domain-containing protein [Pusillimonas sp. TS35]
MSVGVSEGMPAEDLSRQPIFPLKREPLYVAIANQIRQLILRAELKPGSRVQEQYLSDLFDVSRTPLREALKVVAQEGLIEILPNKGARITDIDVDELAEIFQVLCTLQRLSAELMLANVTEQHLAELRAMHAAMLAAGNNGERDRYFSLNQDIHRYMTRIAGNGVLIDLETQLGFKISRARYLANLDPNRWHESMLEHEEIMRALESRQLDRLVQAMTTHIRKTGQAVIEGVRRA